MRFMLRPTLICQTLVAGLFAGAAQAATPVSLTYVVNNPWAGGYCAIVKVFNPNAEAVQWSGSMPVRGTVTSLWNAVGKQSGGAIVFTGGLDWNKTIAGKSSMEAAGFCATDAVTPTPTPTPTPSPGALSPTYKGEGTFYGATGEGNCSYDASPDKLMVAAMNQTDYANSAACGEYVAVTGPKGKVTVRITDRCPECKPGDIDLSEQAFVKVAEKSAGRVPISWNVVAGETTGTVSYRYKEGSTIYWQGIQVLNHRLPITKLEIRPNGSANWIAVKREEYNYFVYPTAIAPGPMQVRITGLGGATLMQTLPEPQGGLVVKGSNQF